MGNAHSNLKDRVALGLAKIEIKQGDRNEYFVREKDTGKLFVAIAKEIRRKEINPIIDVLNTLIEETPELGSEE